MKSYTGKVLWVDLTRKTFSEELIPDSIYQKYLAGMGWELPSSIREIPAGADPLGPQNIMGLSLACLLERKPVLRPLDGSRKISIDRNLGDSNCGGTLAYAIKQCGYDGIFFKGSSFTHLFTC
jgi:aldehyde:ferredoxin oxidoreductase